LASKRRRLMAAKIDRVSPGFDRVPVDPPGRPGSTGPLPSGFLPPPGPVPGSGRPGPGSTCRAGPGFKTVGLRLL
jgi:hypothetical protein